MIDVIVATYNRPDRLARCLAGLAQQVGPDFRAIVVDDCSMVPVSEWLNSGDYPFRLRVVRTPRNAGPAFARNQAASLSDAEYLAFVDDDVVPCPELLAMHLEAHQANGDRSVVIGPLAAPPDWRPQPWTRWEAETVAREYRRMVRGDYRPTWRQFFTGNAFLRREDFLAVGGFNERFLRAEDIEFAYRLRQAGCQFVFEVRAIGWHYSERRLESWRKIPRQYAWSDAEIDRLHPEIGWKRLIADERGRRNPATRIVQSLLGLAGAEGAGASGAIALARTASAVHFNLLASPLLSLAYELEYSRAERQLDRGHQFNSPSTAHS